MSLKLGDFVSYEVKPHIGTHPRLIENRFGVFEGLLNHNETAVFSGVHANIQLHLVGEMQIIPPGELVQVKLLDGTRNPPP